MQNGIYLLLGSNLGDRKKNIATGIASIKKEIGEIVKSSSLYETQPWGETPTETFYNQMIMVKSMASPENLLVKILKIETSMGRIRDKKWENRIIDIDIIFYRSEIFNSENLTIPHPQFIHRNFAILPMLELAPDFVHPILKLSIDEIYLNSTDTGEIILLDDAE